MDEVTIPFRSYSQ